MTTYERLHDEMLATIRQYQMLVSHSQRAPLIAKVDGIKAQLKAYTAYIISGYARGSTNGQRPSAHCIVVTKAVDAKPVAMRAGLSQLRTYKVLSYRLPRLTDVQERAAQCANLYDHECPIIEA